MLFKKKTLSKIDLKDKRVLLRADYNVPIKGGKIINDYRIEQSIPTIEALLEQRCSIVIISHLGRPKGEVKPEFSLKPVVVRLSKLLNRPVHYVDDCVSDEAVRKARELEEGEILVAENLRFHYEEEINDRGFAKKLARLGEVFVQDGFGVVHRAHASTDAITEYLPSAAGLLLENEVKTITRAIRHPRKPLVAIVGGAKIETKIDLLDNLMGIANTLIIGGAMANTFMKAMDLEVGKSLIDKDEVEVARKLIFECRDKGVHLILPLRDVAVAKEVSDKEKRHEIDVDDIAQDDIILDFGAKSIDSVIENLKDAREVIWNGPIGMIELKEFEKGSEKVARYISDKKIQSVVGGGDTVELIESLNLVKGFSHVSTGGGASLELMSGMKLPGIEALDDA